MRSLRLLSIPGILASLLIGCTNNKPEKSTPLPPDTKETIILTPAWKSDTLLTTSESVLYDETYNILYVACIGKVPTDARDGDGFIAKVGLDGKIIDRKWVTDLNGPKGMGLYGEYLYVADISRIVKIDILSGKILATYEVPGATFLNDIAVDQNGRVYVSDTNTNTIYSLEGEDVTLFLQDTLLGGPNGLLVEGDKLLVAGFDIGQVFTVDLTTKRVNPVLDELPGGDGIAPFGDNLLISNWNGEIYAVTNDWQKEKVLDTRAQDINAADITTIPAMNLVLVPTFYGNNVDAYRIQTRPDQ